MNALVIGQNQNGYMSYNLYCATPNIWLSRATVGPAHSQKGAPRVPSAGSPSKQGVRLSQTPQKRGPANFRKLLKRGPAKFQKGTQNILI